MAALAPRRVDPAGDGEDLAAVVGGHVGGDERAAGEVRLDHDGAERHAGDDAVADGEGLLVGLPVERELGDERALSVFGDAVEEVFVLRRENQIYPGSQDGDRAALGLERALMRGGVDAACTAAHDGHADVAKLVGELAGGLGAVGRHHPGTDQRDGVVVLLRQRALHIEDDGWIVDLLQRRRIQRVVGREHMAAEVGDAFELAREVDACLPTRDRFGDLGPDAGHGLELVPAGAEDGRGVAEVFDQLAQAHRSDVLDHVEGDQRFLRIHGSKQTGSDEARQAPPIPRRRGTGLRRITLPVFGGL